ncbi:MAG: SEC-C metal-binding domain-containing protein [Spirochaetota bacterium]
MKVKINRNDLCPCGSGKKYKKCCGNQPAAHPGKKYISEAHEWMDMHILHGAYPDLYGFLIHVDHQLPAEEIWNQLQFWSEQYLTCTEKRTQKFHEIIDESIEYQNQLDIQDGYNPYFCRKGCAHCCYQPVACTDEEARLIYTYCYDKKIDIDFGKIERQLKHIEFDYENNFSGKTTWDDQPEEDTPCIFLNIKDRTCRIWDVRPFVCRVHLAEKTNEFCRSRNGVANPKASGIHYPVCSYILSAIFTIHHDSVGKMMGPLLLNQKRKA